jgi:SAM-dependent methyltransferase
VVTNYFARATVGERYARSRPVYQPHAVRQIAHRLRLIEPLARALDVGCGTGNSSRALADIARIVVGTDASQTMLGAVAPADQICYVESLAEMLPFADATFDLITVASAFHWFDRARFLPEARRVLVPGGWLAVYTTGSNSAFHGDEALALWNRRYRERFPSPPRHQHQIDDEDVGRAGLALIDREKLVYTVTMTTDEFADNLTTNSGVIAAVERGPESVEDVRAWLQAELRPLFGGAPRTFQYEGTITYLQAGYA